MAATINQLRRTFNRAGRAPRNYARPGGYLHPTKGFRRGSLPPFFRMSPRARAAAEMAARLSWAF